MHSIEAILTDLDGVIRHWKSDAIHKKEIECGFEPGVLYSICFKENLLSQVVTGQISDDEWRNRVQTKLARSISESSAKELVDIWTHAEIYIDQTVIEIYKHHYPDAKLILATTKNFSHRIYIGKKMYAEVTLTFDKGRWKSYEYTFADYKQQCYHDFFIKVRSKLVEQLKSKH